MQRCVLRTLMKDAARATHSLVGSVEAAQELNGHCPRRSNLLLIDASRSRGESVVLPVCGYAGILKFSPRVSAAHAMRAFFAAMATTAFQ
jgi:hypothetical protein